MKILKSFFILILILTSGCDEGYIDDISAVDPGEDAAVPTVTIDFPFEGLQVRVREDITSIDIKFEASDDIELQTISVVLDGNEIASFNEFVDFRRFIGEFQYDNLTNGDHTLTVSATDLSGKTSSDSKNFEKIEPYDPMDGEIFYMPFDGEAIDLVTLTGGERTAGTNFVEGVQGQALSFNALNASYATYDSVSEIATVESFTLSFWVNPDFVDEDNDGAIDGVLGLVNLSNVSRFWGNIDFFVENGSNPTTGADMRLHITNALGGDEFNETWITDVNDVPNFFGQWSSHILTYDATSSEFRYYINGALATTATATWSGGVTFGNSGPLVMGCVQFQTDPSLTSATGSQPWASYLTGEMDEIRIFNIALSEQAVTDLYESEKP